MTTTSEFIPLTPLLIKLGAMLVAALIVERFLAILNEVMNRFVLIQVVSKNDAGKALQDKASTTVRAAEEAHVLASPPVNVANDESAEIEPNPLRTNEAAVSRFDIVEIRLPENIDDEIERFQVISMRESVRKDFWMQILGTIVAIGGCIYTKFSVWGFITNAQTGVPLDQIVPHYWEYIFTGIIIGSGSKPVNFLTNFLANRKITLIKESAKTIDSDEMSKVAKADQYNVSANSTSVGEKSNSAVNINSIEQIVGFKYDSGDRPERLELTHHFQGPVDMIVYHHTTLHSDAPFSEVVKEFDRKQWLTGYHCVVFKEGTIRVLCRWDRFGNHAKGYNAHSLGIAFQGSFETDPKVPSSNYNGKLGLLAPTAEQVEAGARVVALWCFMHNLAVRFPQKNDSDFPSGIIPHKLIAAKACPGGNFPYELFKLAIRKYYDSWKEDEQFKSALETFKLIPRVMPNL